MNAAQKLHDLRRFVKELRSLDILDLPAAGDQISDGETTVGINTFPSRQKTSRRSVRDYLTLYYPDFLRQAALPSTYSAISTTLWIALIDVVEQYDSELARLLSELKVDRLTANLTLEELKDLDNRILRLCTNPFFIESASYFLHTSFKNCGILASTSHVYRDIRSNRRFMWPREGWTIFRFDELCGSINRVKLGTVRLYGYPIPPKYSELLHLCFGGYVGCHAHEGNKLFTIDFVEMLTATGPITPRIAYRRRQIIDKNGMWVDVYASRLKASFKGRFRYLVVNEGITDLTFDFSKLKQAIRRSDSLRPKAAKQGGKRSVKPLVGVVHEHVPFKLDENTIIHATLTVVDKDGQFWVTWPDIDLDHPTVPKLLKQYGKDAYMSYAYTQYVSYHGLSRGANDTKVGVQLKEWFETQAYHTMSIRDFNVRLGRQQSSRRAKELADGERKHVGPWNAYEDEVIRINYKAKMTRFEWRRLLLQLPGRTERGVRERAFALAEELLTTRGWDAYVKLGWRRRYGLEHKRKMEKKYPQIR